MKGKPDIKLYRPPAASRGRDPSISTGRTTSDDTSMKTDHVPASLSPASSPSRPTSTSSKQRQHSGSSIKGTKGASSSLTAVESLASRGGRQEETIARNGGGNIEGLNLEEIQAKVEEEVLQKLARASLMSALYKQHKESHDEGKQQQQQEQQPTPKSRGGRQQSKASRPTAFIHPTRHLYDPNNIPPPKPKEPPSAPSSSALSTPAHRQDRSDSSSRSRPSNSTTTAVKEEDNEVIKETDTLESIEARYTALLKRILGEGLLQPQQTGGGKDGESKIVKAWTALSHLRIALATAYTEKLASGVQGSTGQEGDGEGGGRGGRAGRMKGLGNRLWMLYYKEISGLESRFRRRGRTGDDEEEEGGGRKVTLTAAAMNREGLIKGRLEEVLMEGAQTLTTALNGIQQDQYSHEEVLTLMIGLGDLARYAARMLDDEQYKEQQIACLEEAQAWYHRALGARPGYGRAYNQLAIVAMVSREDVVQAAVDYTRALLAKEPFDSRENLITLLDKWRRSHDAAASASAANLAAMIKGGGKPATTTTSSTPATKTMMQMTAKEHKERVVTALLKACHMMFLRVDLDDVPNQAKTLSRHLGLYAQRTLRAGVRDDAAVQELRETCLQSTLLALATATDRATVACLQTKEEESLPTSLPTDIRVALAFVWEIGAVMSGEGEVAEGWDEERGPALLIMLEWLKANKWAWKVPGSRASDIAQAARRRLTAVSVFPAWKEEGAVYGDSWDKMVMGLKDFLVPRKSSAALKEDGTTSSGGGGGDERAQVARCRLLLHELETSGLLSYPSPQPTPFSMPNPQRSLSNSFLTALSIQQQSSAPSSSAIAPSMVLIPPPPPSSATPHERICPSCTNLVEEEIGQICEYCGHTFEESTAATAAASAATNNHTSSATSSPTKRPPGLLTGVDFSAMTLPSKTTPAGNGIIIDRQQMQELSLTPQQQHQRQQQQPFSLFANFQQHFSANKTSIPGSPFRSSSLPVAESYLVVIDGSNVAMRHGLNKVFSCRGIALALDYFRAQGHRALAFLPDYYLSFERVGQLKRAQKSGVSEVRAVQIPDNVGLLHSLVEARLLIGTPPQDYDDSYCIKYAKQNDGYVVTNDLYRDHVGRVDDRREREQFRKWLKARCVSYTFVGDDFVPNPDFKFGVPIQENG